MQDVAILIVTYNSAPHIGACLQSVLNQRDHVTQQLIVVDNNSTDGTADLIRRDFPEVELVIPGRNLGFAAGVNEASRHADAEFVLLLNPDTQIVDQGIDVIVDFARRNPGYGVYGGRTLQADGSLEPSSCWGEPTLWSMALFACGLTTLFPRNRFFDPESLGSWKRDTVREVGVITGCFLLITTENWRRLGGLDERYFMYGEDVDFAMRARAIELRSVICPDATLIHEVGQSSATAIHKMILLYRGKAELVRTHWHGFFRWSALCFLQAGVALRAVLALGRKGESERWVLLWNRRKEWLGGYPPGILVSGESAHPIQPAT